MALRAFGRQRRWMIAPLLFALAMIIWLQAIPAFAAFNTTSSRNASFSAITLLSPVKLNEVPNGSRYDCKVTLSWVIPQPGVPNSWVIQRYQGTSESGTYKIISGTLTSYVDDTVNVSTAYSWKIVALLGTSWISVPTTSNVESLTSNCT